MFKSLLGKLKVPTPISTQPQAVSTPDISRVIRMPVAEEAGRVAESVEEESVDAEDLGARAEAAVNDLSGQFETWMKMDLDKLVSAWVSAKADDATEEDYNALYTCSHNIRGAATSYGYPAISRLCGSLCTLLNDTEPGENTALINLHVEACRAAHTSIGRGEAAQSVADAVCDALEKRVAVKTGTA